MQKEPALVAMSLVYLVQGLTDVAWLAEKYFLKDELGASPAQVSLLLSLASLPWIAKPLLGFLSDSLPLWGYRRRSYLLLASAIAALSWSYLALGAPSLPATLATLLCCSGAGALSDVVVDSMVVERARQEQQDSAGSLQSLCWASYAVGQVATAAFSGTMVERQGPRLVFAMTAAFPLLIGAASMLLQEERQEDAAGGGVAVQAGAGAGADEGPMSSPSHSGASGSSSSPAPPDLDLNLDTATRGGGADSRQAAAAGGGAGGGPASFTSLAAAQSSLASHGSALWSALSTPAISGPVSFLVLLSATPSADDAVFFWQAEQLGFTPAFLGSVQLAGAVASLAGVCLYQTVFKAVPLRSLLLAGSLVGVALRSTDLLLVTRLNTALGLDDHLFVLGGSVMSSVIANVMAMPTLVLAARLCPPGLEATMFALLMSLLNLAEAVRFAGGAALMSALGVGGESGSYEQLPALVALCDAAMLLPLPLLARVPASLDGDGQLAGSPSAAEGKGAVAAVAAAGAAAGEARDPGAYPVPVPVPAAAATAAAAVGTLSSAASAAVPSHAQPHFHHHRHHSGRHAGAGRRQRRRRDPWQRLSSSEGPGLESLAQAAFAAGVLPGDVWPAVWAREPHAAHHHHHNTTVVGVGVVEGGRIVSQPAGRHGPLEGEDALDSPAVVAASWGYDGLGVQPRMWEFEGQGGGGDVWAADPWWHDVASGAVAAPVVAPAPPPSASDGASGPVATAAAVRGSVVVRRGGAGEEAGWPHGADHSDGSSGLGGRSPARLACVAWGESQCDAPVLADGVMGGEDHDAASLGCWSRSGCSCRGPLLPAGEPGALRPAGGQPLLPPWGRGAARGVRRGLPGGGDGAEVWEA